jgi:hypothetical protein
MPKAVEAPTGLSMKLMPIAMIATGIMRVHQKSSEFLLKVELSKFVVVSICFSFPRHLSGELVEGMRIVDSTPTMPERSKFPMSSANFMLCLYRRAISRGSSAAALWVNRW